MKKPKITAIMATCGRHYCSERSMSLFLNQTYENKHLLIYQNSDVYQVLDKAISEEVTLVNNHRDLETGQPYLTLGAIYKDAIKYIPDDTEIIVFWDDDDLFLPNHLEAGYNGLMKFGKTAYKPEKSFFRTGGKLELVVNTLEPSIFVKADHIKKYGFGNNTTAQHLHWVHPLLETGEIVADPEGIPTLIYNWGDDFPTYKTSGDSTSNNFGNYRRFSQDHGDQIISKIDVTKYYKLL